MPDPSLKDFSRLLTFVTVNKDNLDGFIFTVNGYTELAKAAKFKIIVVDSSSDSKLYRSSLLSAFEALSYIDIQYCWTSPSGVYPAMNKAASMCTTKFLCYINSGDRILASQWLLFLDKALALPPNRLIYGHTIWLNKSKRVGLQLPFNISKKILPFLGRMPNHQCMLIPRDLQCQHLYLAKFPIAADLEFKHFLASRLELEDSNLVIVESQPQGISQTVTSFNSLLHRSLEFARIQSKYYGFFSGSICFFQFYIWHSRKVFLYWYLLFSRFFNGT